MCDPTGIYVGIAALNVINDTQRARAQNKFNKRFSEANRELINRQANLQLLQTQKRFLQERAKTAQQLREVSRAAEKAQAQNIVAAAETGTTGASVAAINQEFESRELEAQDNILRNQLFTEDALNAQQRQVQFSRGQSDLSALPTPVQIPNFLDALVRIGGAYATAKALEGPDVNQIPGEQAFTQTSVIGAGIPFAGAQRRIIGGQTTFAT